MSPIGRAFVAVVPPPAVLDAIADAIGSVADSVPNARWATREQWHITLQFLGNHVDLDAAVDALAALDVPRGGVQLGDAGAFPSEKRGRVVWLGLTTGAEVFDRLARAVGALLTPLGYEPEARDFHPHVTLARLKVPTNVHDVVATLDGATYGPSWVVDEVVFMQSFTKSTGAEHVPYARIPLAAGLPTEERDTPPVG